MTLSIISRVDIVETQRENVRKIVEVRTSDALPIIREMTRSTRPDSKVEGLLNRGCLARVGLKSLRE
jgi:hypothetical protein